MFYLRKAQGMPITVIIIAALGLVILVILFALVTGRLAIFGRGISECPGTCVGEFQVIGGVDKMLSPERSCDPTLEGELTGSYVKRGQPANTRAEDLIRCKKCCQPIA